MFSTTDPLTTIDLSSAEKVNTSFGNTYNDFSILIYSSIPSGGCWQFPDCVCYCNVPLHCDNSFTRPITRQYPGSYN